MPEVFSYSTAVAIAKPYVDSIIASLVANYFYESAKSISKFRFRRKKAEDANKRIAEYLENLYGRCSCLNTIAFKGESRNIDDLYVPLKLHSHKYDRTITLNKEVKPSELCQRSIIVDRAGMGKSTASKWLARNTIRFGNKIPVFVEMRSYSSKNSLELLISKELGVPDEFGHDYLKELPIVFLFDGIDEIDIESSSQALKEISRFPEKYPQSYVIASSRHQSNLSELNGFTHWEICPLTKKEAKSLIKKYDSDGKTSEELIKQVDKLTDSPISEYLENPLYVTLLYCAYRHKPTTIPNRRHLFYEQVYNALFETHDASKQAGWVHEKYSKLDVSEFATVLRNFSFLTLVNGNRIEFTRQQLISILDDTKKMCGGFTFNSEHFVKDLVNTVPLFVEDGPVVRWAHKSLHEYFTAMYICTDGKVQSPSIMRKLHKSSDPWAYSNIIHLCSEIDFNTFCSSVLKDVLLHCKEYSTHQFIELKNRKITKEDIKKRREVTFDQDVIISFMRFSSKKELRQKIFNKIDMAPNPKNFGNRNKVVGYISFIPVDDVSALLINRHQGYDLDIMDMVRSRDTRISRVPEIGSETVNNIASDLFKASIGKREGYLNVNDFSIKENKVAGTFSLLNKLLEITAECIPNFSNINLILQEIDDRESFDIKSLVNTLH